MKYKIFNYSKIKTVNNGFTLVELMVTVGIFVLITGLLLARYSNFDRGIILTNLAYDVALTIRSAQSSAINVKSAPGSSGYSDDFDKPYGVAFKDNTASFTLFNDSNYSDSTNIGMMDSGEDIQTTSIKKGAKISNICAGVEGDCNEDISDLYIVFKRPDTVAHIVSVDPTKAGKITTENPYAEITVSSLDGTTKKVVVRSTGQISVK